MGHPRTNLGHFVYRTIYQDEQLWEYYLEYVTKAVTIVSDQELAKDI